jgi:hypothetical protein
MGREGRKEGKKEEASAFDANGISALSLQNVDGDDDGEGMKRCGHSRNWEK